MKFDKLIKKDQKALIKIADRWFSKIVRLRDSREGFGRCISCKAYIEAKYNHAGHYIPRQHMNTRFDPRNVNLQCVSCNTYNEGNSAGYRLGLVRKYSEEIPNELYQLSKIPKKFDRLQLAAMVIDFRNQFKTLQDERNHQTSYLPPKDQTCKADQQEG